MSGDDELGAAQTGSEPPSAAFPGGAASADSCREGPSAAGLCCAEPVYEGSRRQEIKALIAECMAAGETE